MSTTFVASLRETIVVSTPHRITIPDDVKTWRGACGHLYVQGPDENRNVWLSLEVAVKERVIEAEPILS